ncbi:hypothetical protein FQN50_001945 [Emmonsiellopsis sp. PD_5]|nr:hypothetical protein FQN50_001945 [Emmonsiellopsis sp. PD_5]
MARMITQTALEGLVYALLAITSIVFCVRMFNLVRRPRTIQWEDGWLILGYVWFLVDSIVYVVIAPAMFRLQEVQVKGAPPYATIQDDSFLIKRSLFFAQPFFWFNLWSVKFSLLSLYKRLMVGLRKYIIAWWCITVFCALLLVGSISSAYFSCHPVSGWFRPDGCLDPRSVDAARINLWFSFASDVLADLLIMILPIGLIWKLQMPLQQKVSVGGLFGLAWVVIIVSIIRVTELTAVHNAHVVNPTWLAFFGQLEASIALIIGCCPGLYRMFKKNNPTSSYNLNSYAYGKGSSREHPLSRRLTTDIPLQTRPPIQYGITKTTNFNVSTATVNDDGSSQEELTAEIYPFPGR